jgi:hypothetical protein
MRELTDFLTWQWARSARLTGQKVRSNDWFAPLCGAGQSGGLTQSGNSRIRAAQRRERWCSGVEHGARNARVMLNHLQHVVRTDPLIRFGFCLSN